MAPRRRSRAAGAAATTAPPTLGLLSLPDDLLLRCLGRLTQAQRLQSVALVCKRLRALCTTSVLLRKLDFRAPRPGTAVPRIHALLRFLQAHGRNLHQLRIVDVQLGSLTAAQRVKAAEQLSDCLAACGGPDSCLASLELLEVPLPTYAWLPSLAALRTLWLTLQDQPLHLPTGMQQLSCLTELALVGSPIRLDGGAQLPASVLKLKLYDSESRQLPSQISQLSRLSHLIIAHSGYTPAGLDGLEHLASLRSMRILNCHAPACLPALAGLEHLSLDTYSGDIDLSDQLEDAFAKLHSLTSLVLRVLSQWVPATLGSLSRLQRLSFLAWDADAFDDFSLPAGPWLASIRWLGLPWPVLEHSAAAVLANAPNLEYLCSHSLPETDSVTDHHWRRFWRFLATHTPLRCFAVELGPVGGLGQAMVLPTFELMRALLQLQCTRPALRLRCVAGVDFQHEVCERESIPEQDPPAF